MCLEFGGIVGNNSWISSLNRMRLFCALLVCLLFFSIAGEESYEAYAVLPGFIQEEGDTKSFVKNTR